MKFLLRLSILIVMACSVLLALSNYFFTNKYTDISFQILAALNFMTVVALIVELKLKSKPHDKIQKIARNLGVEHRFQSNEMLLDCLATEVERKNQAFSINILDDKISNKEKLSKILEKIVNLAYKLFKADSVELALFDRVTNLYHSSIVIGTPFRSSSQAMLSGAAEGSEIESRPDVLIQPLAFAGTMLGTLRVGLKKGTVPRVVDQEILKLLGMQTSLALINAQYTSELVKMKVASEESLKVKTGFLANLSHEIRAPLGIMLNAVELVIDGLCGAINADQSETLGMVHKNGEHLLELINDVLDYAKVESGRLQANKTDMHVNELLIDVCNVVRSQADEKSHRLICKANDEAFAISCDRRHARQMMINLLSNAIKYTPDGGTIEVWAERAAQSKVKIHVKDTGVGIADSERDRVFAPFERIDNSYSINQVGTGLGMPLTKRLAVVNGGVIDFTSVEDQGSDFWITFPTIDFNTVVTEKEEPALHAPCGNGESILLVEESEGERIVVSKYLTYQGFVVYAASNKQEALSVIKTKKLNLAIVDNKAADESTDDVIKAIRSNSEYSSIPIILVSSKGFIFDIERYLKTGIDRCLIKPLKLSELSDIIRQLMDGTFSGEVIDQGDKGLIESHSGEIKRSGGEAKTQVIKLQDVRRNI